jgi:uncharacterized membrane protein YfcA
MAQSRHRHKHTPHHPQHAPAAGRRHKVQTKASSIMMIFVGVLGLFIAYLSAGPVLLWLAVGVAAGVAAGYFIGRNMDNSVRSK